MVVREAAGTALEDVRTGKGPAFIEAFTYRFVGHSRSDPGKYRPEESSTPGASATRSSSRGHG